MLTTVSKFVKIKLGIYGGVGPFASARFLETIYKYQSQYVNHEQELPEIILYSDTSMLDRTTCLNYEQESYLLEHLITGLYKLLNAGAEKIIICCFTLHYLLPALPLELSKHIISLTDIALEQVTQLKKKCVLLSTKATHRLNILKSSDYWDEASEYIIFLSDEDSARMHDYIYQLKLNTGLEKTHYFISEIIKGYQVEAWIAGCTELHLLSTETRTNQDLNFNATVIDPLLILAKKIDFYCHKNIENKNQL